MQTSPVVSCVALAFVACAVACTLAAGASFPEPVVPDGLGVNIHFTGEPARDLDMIRDGGFRYIRMDFVWDHIEKAKGVYRWDDYDQLTAGLQKRGIRILYILDYSNRLYEKEKSIQTAEGRAAFARFAAAAAARYKGQGILWELWNEPNISFWQPQPAAEAYVALARETLPAIKAADPDATCIAAATSGVALDFLEDCFRRGLVDLLDGVTVHPYRQSPPETVEADYRKLRALIARYRPERPDLPVLSGEWGYSVAWGGYDLERQGMYLPRQFLTNLSLGIPVSIWYDWHDDGPDPREPEHNFGTVKQDYRPKPSYLALQELVKALDGMRFAKRLASAADDRLLVFSLGERSTIAAWTLGKPHDVDIAGTTLHLTGRPQYVPVPADAQEVLAEAAWRIDQRVHGVRGGARRPDSLTPGLVVRVRNPFDRQASVAFTADPDAGLSGRFYSSASFWLAPREERTVVWAGESRTRSDVGVTVSASIDGRRSSARAEFVCVNPVSVSLAPYRDSVQLVVQHASDDRLSGEVELTAGATTLRARLRIDGAAGPTVTAAVGAPWTCRAAPGRLEIAPPGPLATGDWLRARILEGGVAVADSGRWRIRPLGLDAGSATAHNDGDAKVEATFELAAATFGPDAPVATGMRMTYRYGEGWKFVRISPTGERRIEGAPHLIGAWVKGTGTDDVLRMRFTDANGRTFQPEFGRLGFAGWRFLTASMDSSHVGTWGGKPDVTDIVYPIALDTALLVDGTKKAHEGTIELSGFSLIYRE